jgi:hypothetical protein
MFPAREFLTHSQRESPAPQARPPPMPRRGVPSLPSAAWLLLLLRSVAVALCAGRGGAGHGARHRGCFTAAHSPHRVLQLPAIP